MPRQKGGEADLDVSFSVSGFRLPSSGETSLAIGTRVMDAMEADHVVAAMEEARCEQVPECVTGGALSESVRMAQAIWIAI